MYDPNANIPGGQQGPNQPNLNYPNPQPPVPGANYSPYPVPPMQYAETPKPAHGAAIAGLVMNILSIVCCIIPVFFIPGMICSIIAFAKGNRSGVAITGLILGIIGTVLSVTCIILYMTPEFREGFMRGYSYGYNYGRNF